MSFIQKEDNTTVNIKLTDYARKKIAEGELNYSYFVVGDSEIDYQTLKDVSDYNLSNNNILLPFEKNSGVKNPIKKNNSTETFLNKLPVITINEKTVVNEAKERGFFNFSGSAAETREVEIITPERISSIEFQSSGIYLTDEFLISQGVETFTIDVNPSGGLSKFELLKFDTFLNKYVVVATSSKDDSIVDNYGGVNYTRTQDGNFFDGYDFGYPNGIPENIFYTDDGQQDSSATLTGSSNIFFFGQGTLIDPPTRIAKYQEDTGDTEPMTPNYKQRVWANVTAGDRIIVRISTYGYSSTGWDVTIVRSEATEYRCPGTTEWLNTIPNCQDIVLDIDRVKATGTFEYTTPSNELTNVTNIDDVDEGDLIFIPFSQANFYTGSTSPNQFNGTTPFETKWFRVLTINGTVMTLDRIFSITETSFDQESLTYYAYPGNNAINTYYGSGDTTPYWDDASLNFTTIVNDPIDVPVWNLSMIYGQELIGKSGSTQLVTFKEFKSRDYLGFKNFIGLYENKFIGIIHYSNNTISNFYGEGFHENTAKITMPHLLYHRRKQMGINIICNSDEKLLILSDSNSIKYYDLIVEGFGDVYVGKCFPSLKIFIIEDLEILSAMSYKSNRNYTLPNINTTLLNSTSTNSLTLNPEQNIFITYLFGSTINSTGIPYQKIIKYSGSDIKNIFGNNYSNIRVGFDNEDELYFLNEEYFNNGEGYHADEFKVLLQISSKDEPDVDNWKLINIPNVTKVVGGGNVLDINKLTTETFIITKTDLVSGTTYNLNDYIQLPLKSDIEQLNFGDEEFFFGNINAQIEAKVFESLYICNLGRNEFINSNNVTWNNTLDYIYISEVGIYDSNNKLVAMGKLTKPVRKKTIDKIILYLTLDF